MDNNKGLLKRRAAAPSSRGGPGSSDEQAAVEQQLPLYNASNNESPGDKKYGGRSSSSSHLHHRHAAASTNVWCSWGGLFTLALMTLVGYILSLLIFTHSSSSKRMAQQAIHAVTGLRFYTPKLYNVDDENTNKYSKDDFPWRHIHVVHTRFMQEQANLTALGEARLALFQVFCLPTMKQQTSQEFLWMIRTDPNLDKRLLKKLVRLVKPHANFYIVGSNNNFRINQDFPGAWRDGAQGRDLAGLVGGGGDDANATTSNNIMPTRVYSGNRTLLEMAMALEAELPILETRLDADDGLHVQFIETVQHEAWKEAFVRQQQESPDHRPHHHHEQLKWKYWCARRNVQWHWTAPPPSKQQLGAQVNAGLSLPEKDLYGKLSGFHNEKMCITAGITVGFPVGTAERDVPVFPHPELAWMIREKLDRHQSCNGLSNTSNCLDFLKVHPFEAVRSRTPTSHGMLDILLSNNATKQNDDDDEEDKEDGGAWLNYAYWDILNRRFSIQREQVRFVQEYFMDHLVAIAKDNLMGQCTTGHSCKPAAQKALETIISTYSNEIHPSS